MFGESRPQLTTYPTRPLSRVARLFTRQPRMSEPRCRVFLALLPNIRHNRLRALARHLSQRVKRLQGIPPPEPPAQPKKRATAAATRARAREEAAAQMERDHALLWQQGENTAAVVETAGEKKKREEDEEAARRRAEVMDDGWREGPLFRFLGGGVDDDDDDMVLGLLAGCSISTFRRFDEHRCTGVSFHLDRLQGEERPSIG